MKRAMNKIAALFVLAVLCGCNPVQTGTAIESAEAPDFTLKSVNGDDVTLSSFKGQKPVLLVFGATWCPYCVEETPRLIDLQNKYGDSLQILGIDVDEPVEKVAPFVRKHQINYPMLLDIESEVSSQYDIVGVPTLILVGKDGLGVMSENNLSRRLLKAIEQQAAM